jgi:4-hydroxy-tetrahydrodipicolinate reductase
MGPIGVSCARAVQADSGMQLAGLVDLDPAKLGKAADELVASERGKPGAGPKVVASISEALASARADVAIVTTTSKFDKILPTLHELMAAKLHVVSSCEEMSWPSYLYPELAAQIDGEAKKAGVALLGTGVNPGFVMDFLPVVLSSMVTKVTAVKAIRRVDAGTRRQPLQKKVGATLSVQQFNALKAEGKIGHMGIAESVALLATGLGRTVKTGSVRVGLEPLVADREIPSLLGPIQPGQVRGMRNTAHWSGEGLSIELDLVMAVGERDPQDTIELAGPVPLKLTIPGGTPGDTATVAALVNFARVLPNVPPGLKTMLDMPVAGAR